MSHPILVTGAAGGTQGSTGRSGRKSSTENTAFRFAPWFISSIRGPMSSVKQGAEVVEGDLLNPASVQAAMQNVKRAYFTYPVADGLLEAATIFAAAARDAGTGAGGEQFAVSGYRLAIPPFATSNTLPASGICSIGWPTASSTGRKWAPFMSRRRRTTKTCALLSAASVAEQNTVFLPWGEDTTVIPLVGAEDVARVAASLLANPNLPSQKRLPSGQRSSHRERDDRSL